MISDIRSMLNTSSNKQSNASSSALNNTGPLAKLGSEIKLIENMSTIKLSGSESLLFQGKPAQLLHASSANQSFSLINAGDPIDVNTLQSAQITKKNGAQVALELLSNNQLKTGSPALGASQSSITNTTKADNVMLASRVVNLTVTAPTTNQQITMVSDGQTEFPMMTSTKLKLGETIRVMVDANNNVQAIPNKSNTSTQPIHLEALKQSLPKQLSLSDMTHMIKQLQTLGSSPSALSPQTQQALQQLIQNLPNLNALTASSDNMKQAIQTSGLFSESLLLNNKTLTPNDLKLNLMRLKDSQENIGALRLGNTPTEQIANAIERITTSQLRHLSDQNTTATPNYPLHIELPIKSGHTLHMMQVEINQDASTQEQAPQDRRWLVKLKFDFEETGRFDARASIQGNKVGIMFAAEHPDTVKILQKNMPSLRQQLIDKDIEVERLDTFQSKLDKETSITLNTQSLIDVRT